MSDTLVPARAGTIPDTPIRPPVAPEAEQATAPAVERRQRPPLAHTRGGLPAIPLAVATGNTTVGVVAAATLAGGPLALALLAGGAATATGVAVLRARSRRTPTSKSPKRDASPATSRAGGQTGSTSRTTPGGGHRSPPAGGGAGTGRGPTSRHQRGTIGTVGSAGHAAGGRSAAHRTPGTTTGTADRSSHKPAPGTVGASGGGTGRAGGSAAGRIPSGRSGGVSAAGVRAAQVRAARAERSAAAPSVRERRKQDAAARRTVGEARRAAKQAARDERRAAKAQAKQAARPGHQGTAGGTPAARSAKEAARAAKRRAREGQRMARRQARDGRADQRVRDRRVAMRKGAVARTARKRLRRSAWRYWARWAGAALLAGAVGVLGTVTTPIGRWIGAPWLMYPGRRLFARLLNDARHARAVRDQAIAAAMETDLRAAENLDPAETAPDTAAVADTVPRAPRNHNASDSNAPSSLGEPMTATFSFAAVAAEMEALAHTFEPDGMMAVLQMCEELPEALQSIANVFKILAEKADTEFPLEPAVGEAFNEVYITIQMASVSGGEVGPIFRDVHEQDIRRHEDPRNGENKWDTTNN